MENVLLKKTDNVGILTLNRPQVFNSINSELAEDFVEKIGRCADQSDIRAIVVTGEGKAFCAGGDLKAVVSGGGNFSDRMDILVSGLNSMVRSIVQSKKPVLAAINGTAAGGGFSLAMACDLRIASESAKFKQAYTSSGLVPDGGWTMTVPYGIGYARSIEMALLDEVFTADKLLEWGLVNKICPAEEVLTTTVTLAKKISEGSSFAYERVKRLISQNIFSTLEDALANERDSIVAATAHPDGIEGMTAFIEKRAPRFHK